MAYRLLSYDLSRAVASELRHDVTIAGVDASVAVPIRDEYIMRVGHEAMAAVR
jgi:hypothetical protein